MHARAASENVNSPLTCTMFPTTVGNMRTARSPKQNATQSTSSPRRSTRGRAQKLSISLMSDDARWLASEARRQGTSVSAVIAGTVADRRRFDAMRRLLDRLGGTDDLSAEEILRAQREMIEP